jgi:hypothetical protein
MMKPLRDQRVTVMMTLEEIETIECWRRKQPTIPSRGEAIRTLVELGMSGPAIGNQLSN